MTYTFKHNLHHKPSGYAFFLQRVLEQTEHVCLGHCLRVEVNQKVLSVVEYIRSLFLFRDVLEGKLLNVTLE